jgi:methylated-DNA-[protein]-cysteine S-methyltransferase
MVRMKHCSLATIDSPAGPLHIAVNDDGALCRVWFGVNGSPADFEDSLRRHGWSVKWDEQRTDYVARQLTEYAAGQRREFDLILAPKGSAWEVAVWSALQTIPYGETRSYGQIASQLGDASKARAVGWANNANPIPVVIPCHRVIGSRGNLTGFGGGIEAKIRLLEHEGALLPGFA